MSFVHTIYLENGYRFSVPDNDLADVAEKVINYVSKQFRHYTASDIYGIALQSNRQNSINISKNNLKFLLAPMRDLLYTFQ